MIDLMIEITNKCQLRCPTCFSHQDGRPKVDMEFKDFKFIIDKNFPLIKKISLYNYGEPLNNPAIWKMITYAKLRKISFIKVATNGLLLKKNIDQILKSKLDYLSVSLDGATDKTYKKFRQGGDFKEVIAGIKQLSAQRDTLSSRLEIEIQFIITKHNESEVKKIEILAKKLGADFLRLKTVLIKNKEWEYLLPSNSAFSRYTSLAMKKKCFKPLKELVINCDGTIIPCCYITGFNIAKYKLGSIYKQDLRTTLASKEYKDFLSKCLFDKSKNACCRSCFEGQAKLDYKLVKL